MVKKEDITDLIIEKRKIVIIAILIISIIMVGGLLNVEMQPDIEEFEIDNPETQKMEYIEENLTQTNNNNNNNDTEFMQLIFKDENILDRESIENTLKFQKEIKNTHAINQTLTNDSIIDISNFIPFHHKLENKTDKLNETIDQIENKSEELNETIDEMEEIGEEINETQEKLENRIEQINQTADELEEKNTELEHTTEILELYPEIQKIETQENEEPQIKLNTPHLHNTLNKTDQTITIDNKNGEINSDDITLGFVNPHNPDNNEPVGKEEVWPGNSPFLINYETGDPVFTLSPETGESFVFFDEDDNPFLMDPETEETIPVLNLSTALDPDGEFNLDEAEPYAESPEEELVLGVPSLLIEENNGYSPLTTFEDDNEHIIYPVLEDGYSVDSDWDSFNESVEEELFSVDEVELDDPCGVESQILIFYLQSVLEYEFPPEEPEVEGADLLLGWFMDGFEEGEVVFLDGDVRFVLNESVTEFFELGDEIGGLVDELEELEDEVEILSDRIEDDADELEELNETASDLGDDLEELNETASDLGDDLEELNETASDIGDFLEDPEFPSIERQIEIVEGLSDDEFESALEEVLDLDGDYEEVSQLLPMGYVEGSLEADSRMMLIELSEGGVDEVYGFDDIEDVMVEIKEIAGEETGEEVLVLSGSLIDSEIESAMEDTLPIVGVFALLLVFGLLVFVYRDALDIAVGMFGVGLVVIWTIGFMGLVGFEFNQMFIAVPALMIGLSIDYAIHVFMRYREQREKANREVGVLGRLLLSIPVVRESFDVGEREVVSSMKVSLPAVAFALTLVTITTAFGFLANLVSDIPPVWQFGIVLAFGVLSALVIFGVLVPAIKVELDCYLESKGRDRSMDAFGKGGGFLSKILGFGAGLAKSKYLMVVVFAVGLSVAGGVGAFYIDTTFDEEDFLPDVDSGWVDLVIDLDDYHTTDAVEHVNENFVREDLDAMILYEGNVTDPDIFNALNVSGNMVEDSESVAILPDEEPDIECPLTVMQDVKDLNESFNETYQNADLTGDGLPDTNVSVLYDELFDVEEDRASEVIHKVDDEYKAVLFSVSILGDADDQETTEDMREIASATEFEEVNATATGMSIVLYTIQDQVLETVIDGFILALLAILVFLMVMYRFTAGSSLLGFFTSLPVVLAVLWMLGTMYLMDIPFNAITGTITSITIGLGVAYSIHITERFNIESEERGLDIDEALEETVLGTGGALLGSAATTISGFGVLAFSILTPLRQFGLISALGILYAFLASVFVLPSLIKIWSIYVKSDETSNSLDKYRGPEEPEGQN